MPQFELDLGNANKQFNELDSFTQGYIEAMFFTSTGADNEDEGLGNGTNFEEFAPETLAAIILDCATFQSQFDVLLNWAYSYGEEHPDCEYPTTDICECETMAGRDYWYNRNGCGVGFWDRNLGDCGDLLYKACRYSEKYLYRGDDGLLYLD
ncbi:unnamed protein product [Sphagnum tenellum]